MKNSIKIVLFGNRHSGKTTFAAAAFYSWMNILGDILHISDNTIIRGLNSIGLDVVRLAVRHMIENIHEASVATPSMIRPAEIIEYDFKFCIPGTCKEFSMQMMEIDGLFLDNVGYHKEIIGNVLNDCDTIIVNVDTPFLMHGNKVVRRLGNNMDELFRLLSDVSISCKDRIQILFVPLKCERWMRRGEINKVVDAVMNEYSDIISMLKASPKVEISIIPVETVGGIEFYEFRDAYILIDETIGRWKPCSPLDSECKLVALYDGKVVKTRENEFVKKDVDAFFGTSGIERPVQWYIKSKNGESGYSPRNCEQVILHSIKFAFDKYREIYDERTRYPVFSYIVPPRLIGNLSKNDMFNLMSRLKPFIKNEEEGINRINL